MLTNSRRCSNLLPSNIYTVLIQCLFHILQCLSCSIYLHSSLKHSVFLSKAHRRRSMCLNFSFPVWGVYLIPCSCAQHTSNTRSAETVKRTHTHRKHINDEILWNVRGVCVCVCVEEIRITMQRQWMGNSWIITQLENREWELKKVRNEIIWFILLLYITSTRMTK